MSAAELEKECTVCHTVKPVSMFHKNNQCMFGVHPSCKSCCSEKARRINKYPDKRARERVRHRKIIEKSATDAVLRRKLEAGKLARNAVKKGIIKKLDQCQDCGCKPPMIHGHHEDYSKPLEVVWLCPTCHKQRHMRLTSDAGGQQYDFGGYQPLEDDTPRPRKPLGAAAMTLTAARSTAKTFTEDSL